MIILAHGVSFRDCSERLEQSLFLFTYRAHPSKCCIRVLTPPNGTTPSPPPISWQARTRGRQAPHAPPPPPCLQCPHRAGSCPPSFVAGDWWGWSGVFVPQSVSLPARASGGVGVVTGRREIRAVGGLCCVLYLTQIVPRVGRESARLAVGSSDCIAEGIERAGASRHLNGSQGSM